jgi:hypothetical protein
LRVAGQVYILGTISDDLHQTSRHFCLLIYIAKKKKFFNETN